MVHVLPNYCQVSDQIETCLQAGSTILPDTLALSTALPSSSTILPDSLLFNAVLDIFLASGIMRRGYCAVLLARFSRNGQPKPIRLN